MGLLDDIYGSQPAKQQQPVVQPQPTYRMPQQTPSLNRFVQDMQALNQAYQNSYGDQQQNQQPVYQQPYQQQQQQDYLNPQQQAYLGDRAQQYTQQQDRAEDDGRPRFSLSGGTEGMYNDRYRDVNPLETLVIGANQIGEGLMNAPGEIAGFVGGEQAKQDWTFDANKFDILDPLNPNNDLWQLRNFAVSLPGMIVGGPLSGASKIYEAATGTPIQEWREKEGGGVELPDYQLDATQRAASLVDGGIDIVGTFTGGMGRIVGTAGKAAAKKAIGKEVVEGMLRGDKAALDAGKEAADKYLKAQARVKQLDNISKGWITKAGETALGGATDNKVLQTAFDIGDEAAEEFVQSYADDIRNKNLDEDSLHRAITGAAWGGLGGGGMSLTARAINSKNRVRSSAADMTESSEQVPQDSFYERDNQRTAMNDRHLSTSAAKEFADRQARLAKLPGSASAVSTQVTSDVRNHEIGIGTDVFKGIWENGEKSQNQLCESLGVDHETLANILSSRDNDYIAESLNKIIDSQMKSGRPITLVAGRNPDTGISAARVVLKRVHSGGGVQLSRMAYKWFGADVDGDRTQIYFDNHAQNVGYLAANYIDQTTMKSNVDWDYAAFFGKGSDIPANWADSVRQLVENDPKLSANLDDLVTLYRNMTNKNWLDANHVDQKEVFAKFFNDLYKLVEDSYYARWQASHVGEDIKTWRDANGYSVAQLAAYDAAVTSDSVYAELEQEATTLPSKFGDVVTKLDDDVKDLGQKLQRTIEHQVDTYLRRGELANAQNFAQMCAQLGYKIEANTRYANPFFRQIGEFYYSSHQDQSKINVDGHWLHDLSNSEVHSVFRDMLAYSFRLSEVGGEVENAIEGIWLVTIQDDTFESFKAMKVSEERTFDDLMVAFVQAWNSRVDMFNNAYSEVTTESGRTDVNAKLKHKFEKLDIDAVRAGKYTPEMVRAFRQVFGSYRIGTFIDLKDDPLGLSNLTIDQALKDAKSRPIDSNFSEYGSGNFANLMRRMQSDMRVADNRIADQVNQRLKDIAALENSLKVSEGLAIVQDENGQYIVDPAHLPDLLELVNLFNELISPKIIVKMCQDLGVEEGGILDLFSAEGFINTTWGRALLSGDVNQMHDALVSILLSYQYSEVMDLLTLYRNTEDGSLREKYLNTAKMRADEIARQSGGTLQLFISLELNRDSEGGSPADTILRKFTSMSVSHEEKVQLYDTMLGAKDSSGDMLVDAFRVDDEEMALSQITKRLDKVTNIVSSMTRATRAACAAQLRTARSNATNDEILEAARYWKNDVNVEISEDVVANFVFSSKHIIKEMADKGTVDDSSNALYQLMTEMVDGSNYSFLDEIAIQLGIVDTDSFCNNRMMILSLLLDDDAVYTFRSATKNSRKRYDRATFYKEALGRDTLRGGDKPNADDFVDLLEKYPQLVSIVLPQKAYTTQTAQGTSVSAGPDKTMANAIEDWRKHRSENAENETVVKNRIRKELMSNPEWWGYLIASNPAMLNADLKDMKAIIRSGIDRHVEWVLSALKADPSGKIAGKQMSNFYRSTFSSIVDVNHKAFMATHYVRTIIKTKQFVNNAYLDDAADGIFGGLLLSKLGKSLGVNFAPDMQMFDQVSKLGDEFAFESAEAAQNFLDMIECIMSMYDSASGFDSIIMGDSVLKAMRTTLDDINRQIKEEAKSKNLSKDAVDTIYEDIKNNRNGENKSKLRSLIEKSLTIQDYLNGNPSSIDIVELFGIKGMSPTISDDLIRVSDFNDKKAFRAKIDAIVAKYGNPLDFNKAAEKDIDDAFASDSRESKMRLLQYYNNMVLSNVMLKALQGTGVNLNTEAAYQTLQANRGMMQIVDDLRKDTKFMTDIEKVNAPEKLPPLTFHYDNRALSYMATNAAFNAQTGSTGTGIGIDGAMMKAHAAFGMMPANQEPCSAPPTSITREQFQSRNTLHKLGQIDEDDYYALSDEDYRKEYGYHAQDPMDLIGLRFEYTDGTTDADGQLVKKSGKMRFSDYEKFMAGDYQNVAVYYLEDCACGACSNHAESQKTHVAAKKINAVPGIIKTITDWMQEDRHLRRKKSVGLARMLLGNTQDHPEFRAVESFEDMDIVLAPDQSNINDYVAELQKRLRLNNAHMKGDLTKFYADIFKENDLPLGRPHARILANLQVAMVEVTFSDNTTMLVNASDIHDVEKLSMLVKEHGSIIAASSQVVSLEELSDKILRTVLPRFFKAQNESYNLDKTDPNYGRVETKDIGNWTMEALTDWSAYNSDEGQITASDILNRIRPRGRALSNAMRAANTPSIVQRLYGHTLDSLEGNYVGRVVDAKPPTAEAAKAITNVNVNASSIMSSVNGQPLPNVVRYHHLGNIGNGTVIQSYFEDIAYKDNSQCGTYSTFDNKSAAELVNVNSNDFSENTRKRIESIYKNAQEVGRLVIVPKSHVELTGASKTVVASSHTISINNNQFVCLNPRNDDFFNMPFGDIAQTSITRLDPEAILTAMFDTGILGITDSGHYTMAGWRPLARHSKSRTMSFQDLFDPAYANGSKELASISDIKKIGSSDSDLIDMYWTNKQRKQNGRSEEAYKAAIDRYLQDMNDPNSGKTDPNAHRDVKPGDCVGFVKVKIMGGSYKYAPVFFEESINLAEYCALVDDGRGNVAIVYNNDHLDYANNEAMKLDAYGVAYKSVGREATAAEMEKWFAFSDDRFGMFFHRGGPEIIYDANAVSGRIVEKRTDMVKQNLFYGTRKCASNLFVSIKKDGLITRNPLINWTYFNEHQKDLVDLMTGNSWQRVADGEILLFDPSTKKGKELNRLYANLTSEIILHGGYPHLFFCPGKYIFNGDLSSSEPFTYEGLECYNMDFRMLLQHFSRDDVLKIFNGLDQRLCPYGQGDKGQIGAITLFDDQGRMMIKNGREGLERVDTLLGPHYYTGEGTQADKLSREATFGPQHLLKRMLAGGIFPPNIADTISYLGIKIDNVEGYFKPRDLQAKYGDDKLSEQKPELDAEFYKRAQNVGETLFLAKSNAYRRSCNDMAGELSRPLSIVLSSTNDVDIYDERDISHLEKSERRAIEDAKAEIDRVVEDLNKALKISDENDVMKLELVEVESLVRYWMGFSDNSGRGFTAITTSQFVEAVKDMTNTVKSGRGLLVKGGQYRGKANGNRVHIPMMLPDMVDRLVQFPAINKVFPNRKALLDEMIRETNRSMKAVTQVKSLSQKRTLRKMIDAIGFANGYDTISGHVYEDVYLDDIIEAVRIGCGRLEGMCPGLLEAYNENKQLGNDYIKKVHELIQARGMVVSDDDAAWGGQEVTHLQGDAALAAKVMRTLAQTRRVMGMANPMLIPANVGERLVNQKTRSIMYKLGRMGLGPYKIRAKIDATLVHNAARDKDMIKIYSAYREAQLYGAGDELLMAVRNATDVDEVIKAHLDRFGAFEKWSSKFMNIMSGANIGISGQIENFIWSFIMRTQDTNPIWVEAKVPVIDPKTGEHTGQQTILEAKLRNPAAWFSEVMSSNGSEGNADIITARTAMNDAMRGDMAQKSSVSKIATELATRSAGIDLATTALVSPYLNYQINRAGRVLQWIAPISSIYYLVTERVINGEMDNSFLGRRFEGFTGIKFSDLDLEDTQFNTSFQQALMVDAMHLGPALMAFLLMGMMAMDPPDDEDKWGNFQEWTIFGMRVNAEWWIEDILGLALPIACFGRSCQLGKPRYDLILNGLAHYLNNNPIAKVSEVVEIMLDPFDQIYKDYEHDVEGYAKAMGGPPSMADVFYGKAVGSTTALVTQFVTPSFLREWYNDSQQWEKSYKRIYEEGATGRLTEAGIQGKTQYTTYGDAMLRYTTRKNPVMGWFMDMILHPNTSYMASGMPDTIIYDPDQMNSVQAFSLYNDPWTKKEEKTEAEKQAIALQVIAILQSNSDMQSLVQQGFALDSDTKQYVSQFIWDQIASLNEEYYELDKNGELDYYKLGDGDFNLGKAIGLEIKQNHYDQVAYWKSLYYDRLWSEEMKAGVAQYRRNNTTYLQDANGNWYATGAQPTAFMPFMLMDEPSQNEGWKPTLGADENWETQSIVTGNRTGERSLVPIEIGYVETPNIESWSSDGTDTGHSTAYNGGNDNGDGNKNASTTTTNPSYGYPRGGGYRSYSNYNGYKRRGGGYKKYPSKSYPGSGRNYKSMPTPNIYASNLSLSPGGVGRVMNTDRIQDANLEYLRPDFETKGSREAYKRSDI